MSQWSNWEQKFAWLPKRIVVRSQVGSDITYTTIARTELIWMKKYWQRRRISIYYTDKKNKWLYDHAVDLFDLMLPGK